MPIIKRSEDLEAFDDEFAYVNCEWSQVIEAYEEVVSAFEEFSERHGVTLMPEVGPRRRPTLPAIARCPCTGSSAGASMHSSSRASWALRI